MQGRMRVSVVATGISAMAAQQPAPNYLNLDMNRPAMQTGQPALSRPVAPPVMQAAPVAMPVAPPVMAPAPAPAPMPAPVVMQAPPAPVMEAPAPAPIAAQIEAAQPLHSPMGFAPPPPAPMPAPIPAPAPAPVVAAPAPAPVPHKPLVDETDWRVSRPAARPTVRATDPIARPVTARPVAGESRSPNLFQRITGAFAAPRPATPALAAPVHAAALSPAVAEPAVTRTAPENVVAVAPKPVARPAPVQTSISLDVSERAKPARDDDDLQIPAFLRRQAN